MADRDDAQFSQIVGRQLRQDAQVDLILAESLFVSLQPEPPQPAPMSIVSFRARLRRIVRAKDSAWGAYDAPEVGVERMSQSCIIGRRR